MQRLATLPDVFISAIGSVYFYAVALAVAWCFGASIGMRPQAPWFDLPAYLGAGAVAFFGGMFLPPFYFLTWPVLVAALIAGLYCENRGLRLTLVLVVGASAIWTGHSLAHVVS